MKFPKWRPDAPDLDDGELTGLVTCRNVYPAAGGYKPFKGLTSSTGALPAAWVGGGAFEFNGNSVFLGATAAALYSHASGVWTSRHAIATTSPWFGVQFGDLVVWVNGSTPIRYTISTNTGAVLGGSPPAGSTMIAVARGFVFMSGVSSTSNRIYNSALENAEGWTVGVSQCDTTDIPDGGAITGLSGGEYLVAFQESAISVLEYVGTPEIFSNRKVEESVGCIAHGSIARDGSMHYFLSRKGFKAWSPQTGILHIGENAVDQAFLTAYTDQQMRTNIRATVDPDRRLIIWSMPDRLWIYNLELDSWSDVAITGLVSLVPAFSGSAATLESIAATFPSLEDVTPSLDDAYWSSSGRKLLYIVKTDGIGYTFSSGANLEATFKTQKMEPNQGRITHLRNVRLLSDATAQTVNADTSATPAGSQTRFSSSDLRSNGDLPVRASGKFHQYEFIIPAATTWNYAKGYDIEASPGGRL